MNKLFHLPILLLIYLIVPNTTLFAQQKETHFHNVQPGDTWTALAYRFDVSPAELRGIFGSPNPQLQPVIGSSILLHEIANMNGDLRRPLAGGSIGTSIRYGRAPWEISLQNDLRHPYLPLLYAPIFLPGGSKPPKEVPFEFGTLSVSDPLAHPGQAISLQAICQPEIGVQVKLDNNVWSISRNADRLLALGATGAFFGSGTPELRIQVEQHPLWAQPWLFIDNDWAYDQVSFANTAATEQEAIAKERERLRLIWAQISPEPLWVSTFNWPLEDFVELTSHYGARRSVNGGPYDTYHEGTDFSAYQGTPVLAPANGIVVLAEPLVVRGGAVILDHGLGIHTGYYHLSEISVRAGDSVITGNKLGEVGSTGRSTGNHLHWDLLIGTTWVDPEAWVESNLAGWIRIGWGGPFPDENLFDMPPSTW